MSPKSTNTFIWQIFWSTNVRNVNFFIWKDFWNTKVKECLNKFLSFHIEKYTIVGFFEYSCSFRNLPSIIRVVIKYQSTCSKNQPRDLSLVDISFFSCWASAYLSAGSLFDRFLFCNVNTFGRPKNARMLISFSYRSAKRVGIAKEKPIEKRTYR